MSINVGLTPLQLAELIPVFEEKGENIIANRLRSALDSVGTE